MSKSDRLIYLVSLANDKALNELDRLNGLKTYEFVMGSKFIPTFLKKSLRLQKLYVFLIVISSPLWNLCFTLRALIDGIRYTKTSFKGEKLFLLASPALPKVTKNAGIEERENDRWLEIPWLHYSDIKDKRYISVFNLISVSDVLSSYVDAVSVVFYLYGTKGYRFTLPSLKAYRWFIYNKAIRAVPLDVELFFSNHKNTFAVLFDNLPHHHKTLIQHGTEIIMENPNNINFPFYRYDEHYGFWSENLPYKYKHLSCQYCFTEKERVAMSMSIVNCLPETHIVGYSLKNFNENLEGDSAILIIGYYSLFFEREKRLLSMLSNCGIKVYLKNHPIFPPSVYDKIINQYNFTLLNGPRFPKVDVVFTYSSTLALEYEDLGAKIILYDKMDDEELKLEVKRVVDEIKK